MSATSSYLSARLPSKNPTRYSPVSSTSAALGPALLATSGSTRSGTLAVDGTDPTAHVVVEVGETVVVADDEVPADAVQLKGRSTDLVEAFSCRAPFPHDIADDDRWLLSGLGTVFDLVPHD